MTMLEWEPTSTGERSKCGRFRIANVLNPPRERWIAAVMRSPDDAFIPSRDEFETAAKAKERCREWARVAAPISFGPEQTEVLQRLAVNNPVVHVFMRQLVHGYIDAATAMVEMVRALAAQNNNLMQAAVRRQQYPFTVKSTVAEPFGFSITADDMEPIVVKAD